MDHIHNYYGTSVQTYRIVSSNYTIIDNLTINMYREIIIHAKLTVAHLIISVTLWGFRGIRCFGNLYSQKVNKYTIVMQI